MRISSLLTILFHRGIFGFFLLIRHKLGLIKKENSELKIVNVNNNYIDLLITIIIPNRDNYSMLKKCIDSILDNTVYKNYEIIIIENNSKTSEIFSYYKELNSRENIKVFFYEDVFNYSKINNFAVSHANGDYVILLNNDIEIISKEWIEQMLVLAQEKKNGAIGAYLYYPSHKIQHIGVMVNSQGIPEHIYRGINHDILKENFPIKPYMVDCVTGACMMVSKQKYLEVGGLDENLTVAFNDSDFCMKLNKAGYVNVVTPFAELIHYESETRGYEDTPEKKIRFEKELGYFQHKWKKEILHGKHYGFDLFKHE